MDGMGSVAIQMTLALLAMLALLGLLYLALRKVAPKLGRAFGRTPGCLSVVDHLALGPRRSLVLVRYREQELLLGVTDHAVTLLSRTPDHDHDAPHDFDRVLARETAARPDAPDAGPDTGPDAPDPACGRKP